MYGNQKKVDLCPNEYHIVRLVSSTYTTLDYSRSCDPHTSDQDGISIVLYMVESALY